MNSISFDTKEQLIKRTIDLEKSFNPKTGTYDSTITGQLLSTIKKTLGNSFIINGNKISFRKAAIVVIEEEAIQSDSDKTVDLDYSLIIRKTKIRFKTNLTDRRYKEFPTIENFHPENPCLFYDSTTSDEKINRSNRAKKASYKNSLIEILNNRTWIFSLKQTEKRISDTLSEVKIC